MKIIKLSGGLGNQMFQYMYGQYLSSKYNEKVYYDITFYKKEYKNLDSRNIELLKFDIDIDIVDDKEYPFLTYSKVDRIKYLIKCISCFQRNCFNIVFESKNNVFIRFLSNISRNTYYIGYWQEYKYLINEYNFKLKKNQPLINTTIKEKILKSNTVSIGIRRGDYVKLGVIVCDIEYYEKAINIINKEVDAPVYFIFSDDIEWCKENIEIANEHFFVEANQDTPFENMELMSLCKHNIISNSTYDWWGVMLNINKQKIVICPKNWMPNEKEIRRGLIPNEWIKI